MCSFYKLTVCSPPCSALYIVCLLILSDRRWVMEHFNTSPVFTGDSATLYQPCIFAPMPQVNLISSNSTNTKSNTTTNITWLPPDGIAPYDRYLSNCDSTTYCSLDISQCIPRIEQGGVCNSTNQCANDHQCVSSRCNDVQKTWSNEGVDKIHILAGALSASLAVVAGIIALVLFRRRRRLHERASVSQKEMVQETFASFEQCFESGSHNTPAMQQRNLQMRLQQEHSVGDKGDMSTSPPPYSP